VYNTIGTVSLINFHDSNMTTNSTGTPKVKNLRLTNLYFDGVKEGYHLNGLPESPYKDLYLYNITVKNYDSLWDGCTAVDGFCDNSSVVCPPCLNMGKS
jgi:hypothetical protein